jgi:hypothetical protein
LAILTAVINFNIRNNVRGAIFKGASEKINEKFFSFEFNFFGLRFFKNNRLDI